METELKVTKRGRPPVDISWPDVVFTAQDVVDTSPVKVSRVTIHSKLNRAVDEGRLDVVGVTKSKNGRPRTKYMKVTRAPLDHTSLQKPWEAPQDSPTER